MENWLTPWRATLSMTAALLETTLVMQKSLAGLTGIGGQGLKLSDEWAYNIIKEVGNYGEIFDRNVGKDSPLGIARGLNALWSKGGIQYAPPIR